MEFSVPDLSSGVFWAALWKIIVANVILSGDNAVVIALAAHGLEERLRRPAIMFGSLGAIAMLIIFCGLVNYLLTIPYLKLVGGALLLWIGVKLMTEEEEEAEGKVKQHGTLIAAIGTITLANTVMSLDNAIAMAAAAKGEVHRDHQGKVEVGEPAEDAGEKRLQNHRDDRRQEVKGRRIAMDFEIAPGVGRQDRHLLVPLRRRRGWLRGRLGLRRTGVRRGVFLGRCGRLAGRAA